MTERYYRKVIHISAECSPNVRLALAQKEVGIEPTGEVLVPGVLPWDDYKKRRATWDPVRQCIGLDGKFYRGAENLLFPPNWLDHAEQLYRKIASGDIRLGKRRASGIGVDPAEGGANTSLAAVDEYGLIELVSCKTPDTTKIITATIRFMQKHEAPAHRVAIDRGGGGKQLADHLRLLGYKVQTVAFGGPVLPDLHRGMTQLGERVENREVKYAYTNKRAEMYGELRRILDPNNIRVVSSGVNSRSIKSSQLSVFDSQEFIARTESKSKLLFQQSEYVGFALPPGDHRESPYAELRRQLSVFPLLYDREGRLRLPSKGRNRSGNAPTGERTLTEMIGHSPDESDALVLAVYAMVHRSHIVRAGVI